MYIRMCAVYLKMAQTCDCEILTLSSYTKGSPRPRPQRADVSSLHPPRNIKGCIITLTLIQSGGNTQPTCSVFPMPCVAIRTKWSLILGMPPKSQSALWLCLGLGRLQPSNIMQLQYQQVKLLWESAKI